MVIRKHVDRITTSSPVRGSKQAWSVCLIRCISECEPPSYRTVPLSAICLSLCQSVCLSISLSACLSLSLFLPISLTLSLFLQPTWGSQCDSWQSDLVLCHKITLPGISNQLRATHFNIIPIQEPVVFLNLCPPSPSYIFCQKLTRDEDHHTTEANDSHGQDVLSITASYFPQHFNNATDKHYFLQM